MLCVTKQYVPIEKHIYYTNKINLTVSANLACCIVHSFLKYVCKKLMLGVFISLHTLEMPDISTNIHPLTLPACPCRIAGVTVPFSRGLWAIDFVHSGLVAIPSQGNTEEKQDAEKFWVITQLCFCIFETKPTHGMGEHANFTEKEANIADRDSATN